MDRFGEWYFAYSSVYSHTWISPIICKFFSYADSTCTSPFSLVLAPQLCSKRPNNFHPSSLPSIKLNGAWSLTNLLPNSLNFMGKKTYKWKWFTQTGKNDTEEAEAYSNITRDMDKNLDLVSSIPKTAIQVQWMVMPGLWFRGESPHLLLGYSKFESRWLKKFLSQKTTIN